MHLEAIIISVGLHAHAICAFGTGMEGREVTRGERKGNAERERGGRWQGKTSEKGMAACCSDTY